MLEVSAWLLHLYIEMWAPILVVSQPGDYS